MMYNPLKHNIICFYYSTLTHKTSRRTKTTYQLIRVSVFHIRPISSTKIKQPLKHDVQVF
ncbi:hypothetical protein Hanom_Chr03g00194171 [Helianthus anomalus]